MIITDAPPRLMDQVISAILSSSRTATGLSDTSASPSKQKLSAPSTILIPQSRKNVAELLSLFSALIHSPQQCTKEKIYTTLLHAATVVNNEMGNTHSSIWRSWQGKHPEHLPPEAITMALEQEFCPWFCKQLEQCSKETVVGFAATIEIRLNGEIRPFADGCGRISRSLSGALLAAYELIPPTVSLETGNTEYYKDFRAPWERWTTWFKGSVEAYHEQHRNYKLAET